MLQIVFVNLAEGGAQVGAGRRNGRAVRQEEPGEDRLHLSRLRLCNGER